LADGTHLVCDREHEHHVALHMSATGEILGAAAEVCEGRPIREPNDLTLDPAGGFYFTDPGPFPEALHQDIGFICHVDVNGRKGVVADSCTFRTASF